MATSRGKPHFLTADAPTTHLASNGEKALEWNTTQGLVYVTTSAAHPALEPPGARPPEAIEAGQSRLNGPWRRPTQSMTDDAAEAHTYDMHIAILPGALGWASTRSPALTAAHATLQPPGGPPPEEADSVSEGRRHVMVAARQLR